MIALKAHFDGKVLVPDEPLDLKPNQHVRIQVEPIAEPSSSPPGKIQFGQQPGSFLNLTPDWDEPLPDEFWGLETGE